MIKHTPGPWHVSADGVEAGEPGGFTPFGGCGCCGSPWMTAEDEAQRVADARLIAAAPDLLAALQGVLKIGRGTSGRIIIEGWQEEVIRATIAKATGEHHDN